MNLKWIIWHYIRLFICWVVKCQNTDMLWVGVDNYDNHTHITNFHNNITLNTNYLRKRREVYVLFYNNGILVMKKLTIFDIASQD